MPTSGGGGAIGSAAPTQDFTASCDCQCGEGNSPETILHEYEVDVVTLPVHDSQEQVLTPEGYKDKIVGYVRIAVYVDSVDPINDDESTWTWVGIDYDEYQADSRYYKGNDVLDRERTTVQSEQIINDFNNYGPQPFLPANFPDNRVLPTPRQFGPRLTFAPMTPAIEEANRELQELLSKWENQDLSDPAIAFTARHEWLNLTGQYNQARYERAQFLAETLIGPFAGLGPLRPRGGSGMYRTPQRPQSQWRSPLAPRPPVGNQVNCPPQSQPSFFQMPQAEHCRIPHVAGRLATRSII